MGDLLLVAFIVVAIATLLTLGRLVYFNFRYRRLLRKIRAAEKEHRDGYH